ncbi:MAG: hypothetical protein CFH40_01228 [Alphaproteobacteria bacterium MarineAlpha10_Bin3]|jgi:outer membrane biosynthesis protein TonB|nr:MAG: hypothetical protein CFH40_01228 [Alphaproteobacteria bacterium MarineAlpha10_Bin3]PPR71276.1 MAG: hypothetical protein CFH09_01228 [Alphaproteobacteria bacterium MarineAlpha4_Bin1]
MRLTAALSIMFHSAIILFVWLGVPSIRPLITPEQLIEVALVTETATPKPKPAPEPKPAVKLPPPPPPQVSVPEPKPEPEAVPLPKPVKMLKPKPKPKLKPKSKLKPKPKPKPQARRPRPKSKPKPPPKPSDFASVLKTVSKLKKAPPVKTEPKAKKAKPAPDFQKQVAEALKRKRKPAPRLDSALSASKLIATIRHQIEACWSMPAGARGADNMAVEIRILMNPDGRVRSATIVDTRRASRDPFYRAMAESALRAVLNPRCQPLQLPLDKFDEWQEIVLYFDPRDMY